MQNHVRIAELAISKHKLAALIQDRVISEEHPSLVRKALKAIMGFDKKIMTFNVSAPIRGTSSRNKSASAKNKHKQAGD